MKNLILLALIFLISICAYAQEMNDVVYFKNGSIIKGTIIEQIPNKQLSLKTIDGSVFVYQLSEIEKIVKEEKQEVQLDEYGGNLSYGVAIGGGGILGIPVKAQVSPNLAFELGLFYRPLIVLDSDEVFNSAMLAGGVNMYMNKSYKPYKQKVKLNGISIKGGTGFGEFNSYFIGGGWSHESFRKQNKNQSFSLELGPMIMVCKNLPYGYSEYEDSVFGIYWKVQWNWYLKNFVF